MGELVTKTDFAATNAALTTDLAATKADLTLALDNAVLRLTIRIGSMIGAGIAALAILDSFFHP